MSINSKGATTIVQLFRYHIALIQTLAKSFCQFYNTLSEEADKKATFLLLSADFGCSRDAVMKSASELIKLQNQVKGEKLPMVNWASRTALHLLCILLESIGPISFQM